MSKSISYTVHIDKDKAGGRIDKTLTKSIDSLSRSRVQRLIAEGGVTLQNIAVTDGGAKARNGDIFQVLVPPAVPALPVARDLPLDVIYEDEHLIVINKPSGMVVHPAAGHYDDTLVNALLHHCRGGLSGIGGVTRPGIVHRLDKDTSGLLVVAKDDQTHQGLSRQFANHSIVRAYWALVWGCPKASQGEIEGNIGRSPKNRKKMTVLRRGGKYARTHYRILKTAGGVVSLLECRLETGRTHQIRVHLAHKGYSIVGDPVYGGGQRRVPSRVGHRLRQFISIRESQVLHACELGFWHPIENKELLFKSTNSLEINEMLDVLDTV